MENILNDSAKIQFYAHIQEELCNLKPNASDEEIDEFMSNIPKNLLDQKEDLTIICYLFAYYPRNKPKNVRKNAIKLIEKILEYLKKHLQDESAFFWNIFGGLYYFKQIMYEENLITIDKIIQESISENSVAEYFLPEIIEKAPEIFEKEIKYKITTPYTKEYIEEFKELRKKHIKWLKESNDYSDPFYKEIEKDPLRLSIKTDDIDTFQSIVSKLNIEINSKVKESILENSYFKPLESPLIEFAIEFNSIKIFKYLIMRNVKIQDECIFSAIRNNNYDMIHIIEKLNQSSFEQYCVIHSVSCWNFDILNYSIDNYDNIFDDQITIEKHEKIFNIFSELCYSINFQFLNSIFLPFLQKNEAFFNDNINLFLFNSFPDQSAYFTKEIMKHQNIDVNFKKEKSIICKAIFHKNVKAVELLLNNPNLDISIPGASYALPFHFACIIYADSKIIELFCKHKNLDIFWEDNTYHLTALDCAIIRGNFIALDIFLKYFPNNKLPLNLNIVINCINNHRFYTIKKWMIYIKNAHFLAVFRRVVLNVCKTLNGQDLNDFLDIISEIDTFNYNDYILKYK